MRNLISVILIVFAIQVTHCQDYKMLKKQSEKALGTGSYYKAVDIHKQMLMIKPDDAKTHTSLAKCVSLLQNSDERAMSEFYSNLNVKKSKSLMGALEVYKNAGRSNMQASLYEKIYQIDPKEPQSLQYLGKYYMEQKNYQKAYELQLAAAKKAKKDAHMRFQQAGIAALMLDEPSKAVSAFKSGLSKAPKNDYLNRRKLESNLRLAKREVRDQGPRKELMKDSIPVLIENLGPNVNSEYGDYFGATTADESMLLYTSVRKGNKGKIDRGEWREDFWVTTKDSSGNWTKAQNLGEPINTGGHEGLPALSADGQTIYFYMNRGGDGNIYRSTIDGDEWSIPRKMPFCEPEYWETQPTITSDGKTMYFVTIRDAKNPHNSDIYYSKKGKDGRWSKPKSVGNVINTSDAEASPFIHPDGKTLYFSSLGRPGMGSYDIFKSVKDENGKWTEPVNVGYPINTRGADNGFFINALGTRAYYHSTRSDGYGGDDMYVVHLVSDKKEEADSTEQEVSSSVSASAVITVVGVVRDDVTGEPIGTDIKMENLTTGETIQDVKSNSKTGKYIVVIPAGNNYSIAISKSGHLFHSENFNIPAEGHSGIVIKDIQLKKIEVGKKIVLNNIFFETGSAELSNESTLELKRILEFMKKESSIKIEISGHTDNVGSEESNQSLSEQRAASVVNYLINNGVDKGRLVGKGYGESTPIATNDTDEGRQLNRRTEFKVLSL